MIGNPLFRQVDIILVNVIADIVPAILESRQTGGSASAEWIQDNIPLIAVEID